MGWKFKKKLLSSSRNPAFQVLTEEIHQQAVLAVTSGPSPTQELSPDPIVTTRAQVHAADPVPSPAVPQPAVRPPPSTSRMRLQPSSRLQRVDALLQLIAESDTFNEGEVTHLRLQFGIHSATDSCHS